MTTLTRLWTLGFVVVLICAWARPALAQDSGPVFTVFVIEASNEPGGVDPAVRHISKKLAKTVGYTTFRLLAKIEQRVPLGGKKALSVAGKRKLVLQPKRIADGRLSVDVEIRKKGGSPTRVSGKLKRGGTFIVGGYQHGAGRLVFAISATF